MKKASSILFAKNFLLSISVGFFIGLGVVFYFMGPRGVRAQVCRGYVENAKSLAEARAEKESYLESFMPRAGDILVEVPVKADEAARIEAAQTEAADAPAKAEVAAPENIDVVAEAKSDAVVVLKELVVKNGGEKPPVKQVAKQVSRYRKGYAKGGVKAATEKSAKAKTKVKAKKTVAKKVKTPEEDV